jgi:hypothetical protein
MEVSAESVQPGQRALDCPKMPAELFFVVDALASKPQ